MSVKRDEGRWTSAGHTLLTALCAKLSAREVATACRVSEPAVSRLRNGYSRSPDLHLANALKRHFGIPTEAWEQENCLVSNLRARKSATETTVRPPRDAA